MGDPVCFGQLGTRDGLADCGRRASSAEGNFVRASMKLGTDLPKARCHLRTSKHRRQVGSGVSVSFASPNAFGGGFFQAMVCEGGRRWA